MKIISTDFEGLFIIEPTVFEDRRGFFMESYNKQAFIDFGLNNEFVQDNQSRSSYGVLRGLHYQSPPYSQAKLVRVLKGRIIDVVVDIRRSSSTFGKSFSIELTEDNKKQLFVPKGFAHGFSVISDIAEILYKCDAFYNKESEGGLMYSDPFFNINWGIPDKDIILSDKDKQYLPFSEFKSPFE